MIRRFLDAGSIIGMFFVFAWAWLSIPSNIPEPFLVPDDDAYERSHGKVISIALARGWPLIYESREYKRGAAQPKEFSYLPFLALNILEIGLAMLSVGYLSQKFLAHAKLRILIAVFLCAVVLYYVLHLLSSPLVAKTFHAAPIPVALLLWLRSLWAGKTSIAAAGQQTLHIAPSDR